MDFHQTRPCRLWATIILFDCEYSSDEGIRVVNKLDFHCERYCAKVPRDCAAIGNIILNDTTLYIVIFFVYVAGVRGAIDIFYQNMRITA